MYSRLWKSATRFVERRPISTSVAASVLTFNITVFKIQKDDPTNPVRPTHSFLPTSKVTGEKREPNADLTFAQTLAVGTIVGGVSLGAFYGFWYPTLDRILRPAIPSVPVLILAKSLVECASTASVAHLVDRAADLVQSGTQNIEASNNSHTIATPEIQTERDASQLAKAIAAFPFHVIVFTLVPVPWQAIFGCVESVVMLYNPSMSDAYDELQRKVGELVDKVGR